MLPFPREIKQELDKYVVGQERAKRTLSTAISAHYLNSAYQGEVRIKKANVLIAGVTGSGKTMLVETIARTLDVPFYGTAASAISPAGWVGDKAESAVERMYQRAKGRWGKEAFAKSRSGIVYFDEIDKLALRPNSEGTPQQSADSKFNTIQIQQSLLRLIEGTEVICDGNPLDTSRILFVVSGAFIGLDQIINQRMSGGRVTRGVGPVNPLRDIIPADLIAYGFIPEFVGRFPVMTATDPLSENELLAILTEPKNSLIAQKRAMLSGWGCDIEVEDGVLLEIARTALAQGTGARGVQNILEKRLEPYLYELRPNTLLRISTSGVNWHSLVASNGGFSSPPPYDGEPTAEAVPSAV